MILLDMELPCSERSILNLNKYSGITIMNCMKCYNIDTPVVLITQYVNFSDMTTSAEEIDQHIFDNQHYNYRSPNISLNLSTIKYLDQLHSFMSKRFTNYLGAVHYSNVSSDWKRNLMYFIDKIGGNINEGTCSGK